MSPDLPDPDATLEALAERLRRLPPPPVPPGLEARLLAALPPARRARRGRTWLAAAVLLTAAAALLFAVRVTRPAPPPISPVALPADGAPTMWRWEKALRRSDADATAVLDQAMPPFAWPFAEPAARADRFSEWLQ